MAISTASLRHEIEYLRDRIRRASSATESRHYEDRLYRLEGEMRDTRYDFNTDTFWPEPRQYMAAINTLPVPEPETPLSFLKNADKKLLLTGATL